MASQVCSVSGCPNLRPCLVHVSARNHRGVSRHARGHGTSYDRQRAALRGQPCALRLPGCTKYSTSADYPVPLSQGGSIDQQLQPACLHCQRAQGAALARAR